MYCRVHFRRIVLQSKVILAQLLALLTQSGLSGQWGKLLRGSGLSPRCRLMLRRKLDRTGIWVWFKREVKSLGGADAQLVQIRRVSLKLTKWCHRGLSFVCSSKRFKALESEKLRWGSKEQRSPPFVSLVLVLASLRNSKPIQIILFPNATYLVYLVNYFKDYVDIAASSRPIF